MQKIKNIIKVILNILYFPCLLDKAIKSFNQEKQKIKSVADAVDLSMKFHYGPSVRGLNINIIPAQIPEEISQLVEKVKNANPKIFLEIGTATGGTLFLWSQFLGADALIISIDLPFGKYGAGYLSTKGKFYKSFAQSGQRIELLVGDSHTKEMQSKLERILAGRSIDFMFIDGDHTYEGVKTDFNDYIKYMTKGGYIAFHDIFENEKDKTFGTHRFWEEIKSKYEYEEYIKPNREKNGSGIGVLKV